MRWQSGRVEVTVGRMAGRESGGRDERCHGVTKETHVEHQPPPPPRLALASRQNVGRRLCRTLAAPRPQRVATSTTSPGGQMSLPSPRGTRVCGHRRNKCWSCAQSAWDRHVNLCARLECELQLTIYNKLSDNNGYNLFAHNLQFLLEKSELVFAHGYIK